MGAGNELRRLSSSDKWVALACLVLVPYLKAKLDDLHERLAPRELANLPFRDLHDAENDSEDESDDDGGHAGSEGEGAAQRGSPPTAAARFLAMLKAAFKKGYPYFQRLYQGLFLAYQIGYIYNLTRYYSPLQHLAGQELRYVSSGDVVCILPPFFRQETKED